MSNSRKLISAVQIIIALLVVILVIATPFAFFKFSGYGAFALGNTNVNLLGATVAISALVIAYAGYVWGWKSPGTSTAKYAKITLILGAFQWIWVISLVLAIWDEIIYHSTFSIGLGGYTWWLGAASYATVVGAIFLTITGLMAVRVAKAVPPPPPPPS